MLPASEIEMILEIGRGSEGVPGEFVSRRQRSAATRAGVQVVLVLSKTSALFANLCLGVCTHLFRDGGLLSR